MFSTVLHRVGMQKVKAKVKESHTARSVGGVLISLS